MSTLATANQIVIGESVYTIPRSTPAAIAAGMIVDRDAGRTVTGDGAVVAVLIST
jgi:hypothetical protein